MPNHLLGGSIHALRHKSGRKGRKNKRKSKRK